VQTINAVNDVIELQTLSSVIPTQDTELKSLDILLSDRYLSCIERLDTALKHQFKKRLQVQPALTRQLVSFQANKNRPAYRWFKYKEAFSASLIEDLLRRGHGGHIFDPFAGSGTALFAASTLGLNASGIELLPIGVEIIQARQLLEREFTPDDFAVLEYWRIAHPWKNSPTRGTLEVLKITAGAYPSTTLVAIEQYLGALVHESPRIQTVLRFALLCILESISYTRKDGQYLRWDYRAGRRQGAKPFDKGNILEFDQAITAKLGEILCDTRPVNPQISLFEPDQSVPMPGQLNILHGSCLQKLQLIPDNSFDAIITSPPYCNRYDYTRTYALELALLGVTGEALIALRQEMLSCTVENRPKALLEINSAWKLPVEVANRQELLQAILEHLDNQKERKLINNTGIPRMVKGYFYEMACVIFECLRVLKPGAPLFMVNDNVRYAGASISVDLILSDIAEKLGFRVPTIMILPQGKGNSSQQMGEHGRDALRKCVYVWEKP
jgi:DNA modification methylase